MTRRTGLASNWHLVRHGGVGHARAFSLYASSTTAVPPWGCLSPISIQHRGNKNASLTLEMFPCNDGFLWQLSELDCLFGIAAALTSGNCPPFLSFFSSNPSGLSLHTIWDPLLHSGFNQRCWGCIVEVTLPSWSLIALCIGALDHVYSWICLFHVNWTHVTYDL